MAEEPEIDGRRREELLERAEEIAPYYTDEFDPESDGPGRTLLRLFAELAEGVTERLDRVPAKHRVGFVDAMGFDALPPQPAAVPIVLDVADGAGESVTVPAGTQAVAAAAGERPEQTFEVGSGDGMEAVPANLARAYSVAPDADEIFEHWTDLQAGERTRLFREYDRTEDRQSHVLYVGHADQLAVAGGSGDGDAGGATLRVALVTGTSMETVGGEYAWEYYGTETEDGPEGWHPFAGWSAGPTLAAIPEPFVEDLEPTLEAVGLPVSGESKATEGFVLVEASASQRRAVGEALASLLGADADLADVLVPAIRTLDLDLPGTLVETAVDEVESRWIRSRVPGDYRGTALFDLELGVPSPVEAVAQRPVWVGPKPPEAGMDPDLLLANDVEVSPRGDPILYPLGDLPRVQDAFYVASEEAFTKAGVTASVVFEPLAREVLLQHEVHVQNVEMEADAQVETDGGTVDAEVAWEYWDGSAWSRLDVLADGTENLTKPGPGDGSASVDFVVPEDLAATSVSGHDGHWVRARLVGGSYGEVTAWKKDEKSWVTDRNVDPPAYAGVSVEYSEAGSLKPARRLRARNNLDLGPVPDGRFAPFVRVPEDDQTLYVGVDGPLDDGPVNLLFDVAEQEYPEWFHSRVQWEYRDPADGEWARLDVRDGTEGLTERGVVSLVFPEETVAFERFGRRLHWIRARVTGTPFEGDSSEAETDADGSESTDGPEPCGETVRTAPPAGRPENDWPELDGLYLNAVWVHNVRTVSGETLGSSDGTADQAFVASTPPVTTAEVWVDELQALSAGQRDDFREATPDRVEAETGPEGEPGAFWVRWEQVPGFLDSGADDRHYVLDRSAGRISFGDGRHGKIPPRGADNVRLSYETGGGSDGNVEAGAVGDLKSPIPFVESVSNPIPADGGADAESTDGVLERAPKQLRDRDRAVAEADFERIAMDASRRLARANCIPAMDRTGEHAPGWVTVLVVPSAPGEKPVPSVTLKGTVREALAEHAPATLVADPEQLVVRGPSYVPASVTAELETTGAGSVSAVEEAATDAVSAFLHPLSGGEDGTGWEFGEMPCLSELYALLEGVDGVDHVADLELRLEGRDGVVVVREGEESPDSSPDALVHSDTHEIVATIGGPAQAAAEGGP